MRTTMNLPDDLYRSARVRAATDGRTVTSIMEAALRAYLDEHESEPTPYRVRPIKMGLSGELPFDVNSNAEVQAFLDSGERLAPRAHS